MKKHRYNDVQIKDIAHIRMKTKSSQTNGICERFHRKMQPGGKCRGILHYYLPEENLRETW